jgi:hypothetical protein
LDPRPADPPQYRRWRLNLLQRLTPARKDIETLAKAEGTAGPSRAASRPPRTSSPSTTMRPSPGAAGTATSPWSCSPFAMTAAIRHHANIPTPPQTKGKRGFSPTFSERC